MIKSILVTASGSATDEAVFATALAIARPLGAHLEFYHLRLSVGEAASRAPHVDFCVGTGLPAALDNLRLTGDNLSADAASHFRRFCEANAVPLRSVPADATAVSASWFEETDDPAARLLFQARHNDLIVAGRRRHADLMPTLLLEDLLMESGRPLVIAPETAPESVTGTIVVGCNETPQSTRALAAATPLLQHARKVVLANITEERRVAVHSLEHLARQLKWHGISAECRVIEDKPSRAASHLTQICAELHADLLVVGGYGHGPIRELVFGGVTRSLLEQADVPVFILH